MIRDANGQPVEPNLTPPEYWEEELDYADMTDEQRVEWWLQNERPRSIAEELVDREHRLDDAHRILRRHGLIEELYPHRRPGNV